MGKLSGIPLQLQVDDSAGTPQDISNDVNTLSIKNSRGEWDVTGLDKSAIERQLLLGDAEVSLSGVFNEALSHRVFRDCGIGNPREVTITLPGGGGGALHTLVMNLVFASYVVSRGNDGALTWATTGKLADGTVPTWAT